MKNDLTYAMRSATLLALCVALTGCMSFNPRSLRQMESALRDSNPDMEFVSTTQFSIGALTMDLIDFAFVHDRSIDMSKISRADIGVYELKHPLDLANFRVPQGNERSCPQRQVIMRVMEDDEHMEMAVCIRGDRIIGFAIFMLEPDEIVVINARGDIQAFVSSVLRDNVNRGASRHPGRAAATAVQEVPVALAADETPAAPAS